MANGRQSGQQLPKAAKNGLEKQGWAPNLDGSDISKNFELLEKTQNLENLMPKWAKNAIKLLKGLAEVHFGHHWPF